MTKILKIWATPLTAGAFLLMATTGILMFFHLDSGVNKLAHEWLGWGLVIGGLAHITLNFKALVKYLKKPVAASIIGLFAVLLALSFFFSVDKPNPAAGIYKTVVATPIGDLLPLAKISEEQAATFFEAKGAPVSDFEKDTISSLAAGDREKERELIGILFRKSGGR